ncbi:efflux transporter outer membrane subunit (plasmid) [Thioclava litoralis]|uniref:Efflux transporter outer membrane subunit n=1 Tax=Thioclava litoralis TaxID=3076557 RepID=A0ABZ1E4W4_9RHOB|nr:efflux transporter outer membrane subunit [Thioclava sp. FTW29]
MPADFATSGRPSLFAGLKTYGPYRPSLLLALSLGLAGCAALPSKTDPTPDLAIRAAFLAEATTGSPWWQGFKDPTLDQLEQRALQNNLTLQQAVERIVQSRQSVKIANASLLPSLSAEGSVQRGAFSAYGADVAAGASPQTADVWDLGVQTSWEADLFGRARNTKQSARMQALSAEDEMRGAMLALTAEVASTYIQLRAAQQDVVTIRETLDVANHAVRIARARVDNGISSDKDIASSRAQLADVQALLPRAEAKSTQLMNSLAALLGQPPHALDTLLGKGGRIPTLTHTPPSGLPSDLALKRPDVHAADANLHAAISQRQAAKADFYPSFSISARAGKQAFDLSDFDAWNARYFGIGPTVSLPIFSGGKIVANYELSRSRERAAASAYQETLIRAWEEIANAMTSEQKERQRLSYLRQSVTYYQAELHSAERNYEEGLTEYLPQLVAQRDVLTSRRALTEGQASASIAAVNLFRAIGGDYRQHPPLASAQAQTKGQQPARSGAKTGADK